MTSWEASPPGLRSRDAELTVLRVGLRLCETWLEAEPERALPLANRAGRLARWLREPVLEAWAGMYGAGSAYRMSRYDLCQELTQASLILFTQHDDRSGLASAQNMLGLLAEGRGDLTGGYTHLLEALHLARDAGDARREGVVLGNLATVAQELGDIATALEWTLSALDHARTLGDQATVTRVLVNTSTLYSTLGQHDAARRQAEQALTLAQKLGRISLTATAYTVLGEVCSRQHDHEAARHALTLGVDLARQTGDPQKVVRSLDLLAATLLALGAVDEAHLMTREGLDLARHVDDRIGQALLEVRLGMTLGRLGETQAARRTLVAAQALAEQYACEGAVIDALRARSELEQAAGDFEQALLHFQAYHDRDKAQFGEAQSRRAQGLLVTHRVDELERLHEQLREANRKLTWTAYHDSLTGARNRRAFEEVVAHELDRLGRVEVTSAFSLALLDVDHFKRVNDRFGHATGDAVLRRLVEVVQGQLRGGDVLGRWGGEEFALFFPLTSLEEALAVCERLRQAVEAEDWSTLHTDLRVTASFGVTAWRGQTTLDALTRQADGGLYAAKGAGRNRVEAAQLEASAVA